MSSTHRDPTIESYEGLLAELETLNPTAPLDYAPLLTRIYAAKGTIGLGRAAVLLVMCEVAISDMLRKK